jgi:hypothetical protein
MYHGGSYPVTIQVQNTGLVDWDSTADRFWGLSYHWTKVGFEPTDSSNRAWISQTVPIGDPPYTFELTINDIPSWGPGAYTLRFDMLFYTSGLSFWFSTGQSLWPTYDITVCVDGPCKVFLPMVLKDY